MRMLAQIELSGEDQSLFQEAWDLARAKKGEDFTFYLPGMIRYGSVRGRYPAISISGDQCALQCEHCRGLLLKPMIQVSGPRELEEKVARLRSRGAHGVLLSGGADASGRLPWRRFAESIHRMSTEKGVYLTAHAGFPDDEDCALLAGAGVRQALVDVMGDHETASRVYHLPDLDRVSASLEAIARGGIPLAPHVVAGLYYGSMRSEVEALKMLLPFRPAALVIVVLTPLPGTPMAGVHPPSPLDVARLIARARILMPDIPISLGCERPRNREGLLLERLAVRAGITRMAVWSEEAVRDVRGLGLNPRFQATCCSLPYTPGFSCEGPEGA